VAVFPWATKRATGDLAGLAAVAGRRDARCALTVEALPELVAYGAAGVSVGAVSAFDRAIVSQSRRPAGAAAAGLLASGVVAALTLPAVVYAGASAVRAGRLDAVSLGVLAVCVLIGFEAVNPMPAAFGAWARCAAGLTRVAAVLSADAPYDYPAVASEVADGPVGLAVQALWLAPAPDQAAVLRDADLRLAPNERIAVIGPSGCGKSTLLAAALRLIRPAGGAIAITAGQDTTDLADLSASDVPPLIAGSLQGDHVFDSTLRDNLRVVRPEATDADLDAVARRVGLTGCLAGLPDRWSAPTGPDGAGLSGGQRQRLLLARALLADPRILVLDEPTAHLDERTERAVLDDLLDATAGRTVLLSTHRRLPQHAVTRTIRFVDGRLAAEPNDVGLTGVKDERTAAP